MSTEVPPPEERTPEEALQLKLSRKQLPFSLTEYQDPKSGEYGGLLALPKTIKPKQGMSSDYRERQRAIEDEWEARSVALHANQERYVEDTTTPLGFRKVSPADVEDGPPKYEDVMAAQKAQAERDRKTMAEAKVAREAAKEMEVPANKLDDPTKPKTFTPWALVGRSDNGS